jgi:hypothetical protein
LGSRARGAIWNDVVPPSAPATFWPVSTVTFSPGVNGFSGFQAAPLPSGWSVSSPSCSPLREPVTFRPSRSSAAAPRIVIPVRGEAATVVAPG